MVPHPGRKPKEGIYLSEMRRICLNLPETEERFNHGMPGFAIKNRSAFVFLRESRKENHVALWFKASSGVQEELVEQDPDRFFAPPYLGPAGWVGMRLDIDLDWEEVTEAMVRLTGEEKRDGNWVLIEETNPGEWAIGGKPVGLPIS